MTQNSLDPLKLDISLETLKHLGMNLYGSMPPVVSELIANAYDARARVVTISVKATKITIEDDGIGMDRSDVQNKYLIVGRDRREEEPIVTDETDLYAAWPRRDRPMGRKGIGKLAMFSMAKNVIVSSIKHGSRTSFEMTRAGIEKAAKSKTDYYPEERDPPADLTVGTRVELSDFRRATPPSSSELRKAIARRFSVIDIDNGQTTHNFRITVDGDPISVTDWDVFNKIQFLWYLGPNSEPFTKRCANLVHSTEVDSTITYPAGTVNHLTGWIGTVASPTNLTTSVADMQLNDNRIVIDCRGKVAIANFLHQFGEAGVYASYLAGYIQADFLDSDQEDIATSDRERMREDDPRVATLRSFIRGLLKRVEREWRPLRIKQEETVAAEDPIIGDWLSTLNEGEVPYAKRLMARFGGSRIAQGDKRQFQKYAILAFERLRVRHQLELLETATTDSLETIALMFALERDLEDALYADVARQRLEVVRQLTKLVDENAKERIIQDHVYEHLWLLEPSWTKSDQIMARLEERVTTEFGNVQLTKEERESRFDIKYRQASGGIHVIVELKKPSVRRDVYQLLRQVHKYRTALQKCLREVENLSRPNIQCVCLVGSSDLSEDDHRQLEAGQTKVLTYDHVISEAQKRLEGFLNADREFGRIQGIIKRLDAESGISELA